MLFCLGYVMALLLAAMPFAFAQTKARPALIDGFRSAKFGMSEIAALQAISADFSVTNDAITQTINPVTGTHLFKISVQNLLPHGGQADITYSFGYQSDRLDEIDITWDAAAPGNSPAVLLQTGTALQNHFLSERFPPAGVASNALLSNGNLLLFRATDEAGHAVALFISGPATQDGGSKTSITPADLTLAFAADPSHPDVFAISSGH